MISKAMICSRQRLRAFGLLQAVGAAAVGLVIVTGSLMMMNMTRDANISTRARADFDDLMTELARAIETKAICEELMKNIVVPDAGDDNLATTGDIQTASGALSGLISVGTSYGSDTQNPSITVTNVEIKSEARKLSNRKKAGALGNNNTRFHYMAVQVTAVPKDVTNKQGFLGLSATTRMQSSIMHFIAQVEGTGPQKITSCHCRAWSDCPALNAATPNRKGFYP